MSLRRRLILTTLFFGLALLSLVVGLLLIDPSGDVYHEFATQAPLQALPNNASTGDDKLSQKPESTHAQSTALDGHTIQAQATINAQNKAQFFVSKTAIGQVYICGNNLELDEIATLKVEYRAEKDDIWQASEKRFEFQDSKSRWIANDDEKSSNYICKAQASFSHLDAGNYQMHLPKGIDVALVMTSERGPERLPLAALCAALICFILSFCLGFRLPTLKVFEHLNLRWSAAALGLFVLAILALAPLLATLLKHFPQSTLQSFQASKLIYLVNFYANIGAIVIILSLVWLQNRKQKGLLDPKSTQKNSDNETCELRPTPPEQAKQKQLPTPQIIPIFGMALWLVLLAFITLKLNPPNITNLAQSTQGFSSLLLLIMAFSIFAAIVEEVLYRGVTQTGIENSLRRRGMGRAPVAIIAILIPSLMFVAMHIPQTMQQSSALIPIATLSLLAGILKWHHQRIFPSIALHMLYNATILLTSFLAFP